MEQAKKNALQKPSNTSDAVVPYRSSAIMQAIENGETNYLVHAPRDVSKAVATAGNTQISAHRRQDEQTLNMCLLKIIDDFGEAMGGIKPVVQGLVVNRIKNDYWYFTLEEIILVLSRGIDGRYGNQARGALPMVAWFRAYDEGERLDYCEQKAAENQEPFEKGERLSERLVAKEQAVKLDNAIQFERNKKIAKQIVNDQDEHYEKPIKPPSPSVAESKSNK